jgi:hypothetical protein
MRKLILLIAVAMLALGHRSDGQQARPVADQLKLAAVMPRGAMLYLQTSDLAALMKTWLASPVRSQFYDSASFASFQKSRVYLKLQDRKKDIETAIGIGLDENRLAELAGRESAISIYDIGKIEIVFVTEVSRARAVASALFKQAPQFQERSADGTSYYVRDVSTDGGRLNQQFCFAYVDGKFIVTTTEGLMLRAIANTKAASDSLLSDVAALAEQAKGFAAHDVTMWLDQSRLNSNRYFDNYWIHHNAKSELASIESALIDLRMAREGMTEQRWFKMGAGSQGTEGAPISKEQATSLMKFVPSDAQLVELHAATNEESLSSVIGQSLFGKLPSDSWSPGEVPDRTRKSSSDGDNTRTERYSWLDERFDMDVDDEQAPKRGSNSGAASSGKKPSNPPGVDSFAKNVSAILSSVASGGYCEMVRSKVEAGKPFVTFERAVIIQMKPEAAPNREALERAVADELRSRFVVSGSETQLEWQDDGPVRFVAQTLLEQGAAYSVTASCLVLASSKEFAADILQAAKATSSSARGLDEPLDFYALIRVSAAKAVFDTLMSKLDGRTKSKKPKRAKDDQEETEIKFFSDNLSSLVASSSIGEIRLTRRSASPIMTERVVYSW